MLRKNHIANIDAYIRMYIKAELDDKPWETNKLKIDMNNELHKKILFNKVYYACKYYKEFFKKYTELSNKYVL